MISKQGDTVYSIALDSFCDIMAHKDICSINNIELINADNELIVGTIIKIPDSVPENINMKRYKWWKENKKLIC